MGGYYLQKFSSGVGGGLTDIQFWGGGGRVKFESAFPPGTYI